MQLSFNQKYYAYYQYFYKIKDIFKDRRQKYSTHFNKIKKNFYQNVWTELARDLGAEIQDIGYGFYKIQLGSNSTYVSDSMVMLDNHLTLRIAGNKPLIYKILSEHHYPVVKYIEYDLKSLTEAFNFLKSINRPGVVKPAFSGAAGKGITIGINSWNGLKKASFWAAIFGSKLVLEEQAAGDSYRLLYLNGQYLDAVKRNPPRISGDGNNSIKKIIEYENLKRITGDKIISLHPIIIDPELLSFLKLQGYHLHDILPQNKSIPVKRVVNQNSCYENESVRTIVHPTIIEMGSKIAKLLNVQLAGIDIICKNITEPLNRGNGVINEVNTTPGLHHHYLISKKAEITPVAFFILKFLLNS